MSILDRTSKVNKSYYQETAKSLHIDERQIVRDLMDEFFLVFGGFLRVYEDGRATRLANEHRPIKDYRPSGGHFDRKGEIICPYDLTVGEFCYRMYDEFGLTVEVATRDNRVLIPPEIALEYVQVIRTAADIRRFL